MNTKTTDREPGRTTAFTIPALPSARRTGGRVKGAKAPAPKLVGYYTKGKTPNWTRVNEYHAWKDHVRLHAPRELLALRPRDEASRVRLDVVCYFAHGTHGDPENVRKGIVDALFPHGDKWVYGHHDHPHYDPQRPRVEVSVTVFGNVGAPPHRRSANTTEQEKGEKKGQATRRQEPAGRTRGAAPSPPSAPADTARTRPGPSSTAPSSTARQSSRAPRTFWAMLKSAFEEAARPPDRANRTDRANRKKAQGDRAAKPAASRKAKGKKRG